MKRQKNIDVFDMITQFQKTVVEQKPSIEEMSKEVRMMKYKIRPVVGDVSLLNFKNPEFIEALWGLGKLDEFFRNYSEKVKEEDLELFVRLIEEMRFGMQKGLNEANLKPNVHLKSMRSVQTNFEIEIYKERSKKLN